MLVLIIIVKKFLNQECQKKYCIKLRHGFNEILTAHASSLCQKKEGWKE